MGLGTGSVVGLRAPGRPPDLLRDRSAGDPHLQRPGALQLHHPLRQGAGGLCAGRRAPDAWPSSRADIFDILLIDAFSSDAVPTHLLTVEAVRGYLTQAEARRGADPAPLQPQPRPERPGPGGGQGGGRRGADPALSARAPAPDLGGWPSPEDAVIVAPLAGRRWRGFAHDPRWQADRPDRACGPGPTTTPTCSARSGGA